MTENKHFVGAGNARADVALGDWPDSPRGENAMRFGETPAQSQNFRLRRHLGVGMDGIVHGHGCLSNNSLISKGSTAQPEAQVCGSERDSLCPPRQRTCEIAPYPDIQR